MSAVISIDNICVNGWMNAIRGMRNSRQSWDKMDSKFVETDGKLELGPNDLELASFLAKLGGSHAKFRRMIHVSMDVTAPMYWWKEFDTYKVGTTVNSTSTMYSITEKEFTPYDFAIDYPVFLEFENAMTHVMSALNSLRDNYVNIEDSAAKNKVWREIIQLLPESYKQLRTVDCNYEVLSRIVKERKHHRLREWPMFINGLKDLPYSKELIFCEEN